MIPPEVLTRAQCSKLFVAEIARLSQWRTDLRESELVVAQTERAVGTAYQEVSRKPVLQRVAAHVLDFARIHPIVSAEVTDGNREALEKQRQLNVQADEIDDRINYYGINVPGEHGFRRLAYFIGSEKLVLEFFIVAQVGDQLQEVNVRGVFSSLSYRTVGSRLRKRPTVLIPSEDALPHTLVLPRGHEVFLEIRGINSDDIDHSIAFWRPKVALQPTPIDIREFIL